MKKSITNFIVDKFYGGKVLKAVVNSTLSNETINTIKDFMEEHSKFWDTTDEEHKFIYTEIHGNTQNFPKNPEKSPCKFV